MLRRNLLQSAGRQVARGDGLRDVVGLERVDQRVAHGNYLGVWPHLDALDVEHRQGDLLDVGRLPLAELGNGLVKGSVPPR